MKTFPMQNQVDKETDIIHNTYGPAVVLRIAQSHNSHVPSIADV